MNLATIPSEILALYKRCAELQADKDRLDWIEQSLGLPRAAIDAARKKFSALSASEPTTLWD
jgi:hypothetical protein